jgi:hypothetical protein
MKGQDAMDLKKTLLPVALFAVLAPLAAFAEHDATPNYDANYDANYDVQGVNRPVERPMPPTHSGQGRYELRTMQRWVEGQWQQVWVPEQCVTRQRGWKTRVRCQPGYYDSRWTPGHYVTAQQWVWIPYNHPPAPYPQRYGRDYRRYDRPGHHAPVAQHPATPVYR